MVKRLDNNSNTPLHHCQVVVTVVKLIVLTRNSVSDYC